MKKNGRCAKRLALEPDFRTLGAIQIPLQRPKSDVSSRCGVAGIMCGISLTTGSVKGVEAPSGLEPEPQV